MRYSIKLTLLTGTWLIVWVLTLGCGIMVGKKWGIAEGRSIALKTNPVSEELEMVCTALWVGEQNKKYFKGVQK